MRPVNLLPPEERRGGHAPMRTGAMPYVILGALVLLLVGIVALVLTGNQVSEREDEVANLQRENAAETARADRLAAYTQFHNLQEQRVATVRSLADSRFDWERVMRELALILPENVWLVEMAATATPDASTGGGSSGGSSGLRAGSPGPALELTGCAVRQNAVAGFVTALKDIDGVTRVGVQLSELPGGGEAATSNGGESENGDTECRTRKYIARFKLVVVFDAAPVPLEEGEAPAPATEIATSTSESESSEDDEEATEGEGG